MWRWRLRHPIAGIHCIIVRALDGQFPRVFPFFALKEWVATCSALTASSSKVRYSDKRQFFQARDLTRLEDLWSSQILTTHSLISMCLGDMPVRTFDEKRHVATRSLHSVHRPVPSVLPSLAAWAALAAGRGNGRR